jgi:hypothetical protein
VRSLLEAAAVHQRADGKSNARPAGKADSKRAAARRSRQPCGYGTRATAPRSARRPCGEWHYVKQRLNINRNNNPAQTTNDPSDRTIIIRLTDGL